MTTRLYWPRLDDYRLVHEATELAFDLGDCEASACITALLNRLDERGDELDTMERELDDANYVNNDYRDDVKRLAQQLAKIENMPKETEDVIDQLNRI